MAKEKTREVTPSTTKEQAPATATPARAISPFEEFDRLFEEFMPRGWMRPMGWERPLWNRLAAAEPRMPRVDIVDRDNDILVRAEVPGVDRKDLDISVSDNAVTIKGQSSSEVNEEQGDYHRCEISRGAFARTVGLPGAVDADKASAEFKDGVLELTLPKVKQSRRRRIEVK
jgi:HSP20 family protein